MNGLLRMSVQTVLLFEDETSTADMVLHALKSEGFGAQWHTLGREGISWSREHPEFRGQRLADGIAADLRRIKLGHGHDTTCGPVSGR